MIWLNQAQVIRMKDEMRRAVKCLLLIEGKGQSLLAVFNDHATDQLATLKLPARYGKATDLFSGINVPRAERRITTYRALSGCAGVAARMTRKNCYTDRHTSNSWLLEYADRCQSHRKKVIALFRSTRTAHSIGDRWPRTQMLKPVPRSEE